MNYYNNKINKLISEKTDDKRTIMDIDGLITKYGKYPILMYDYKSKNDTTTVNTLRQLSNFSNVKLNDNRNIKTFIISEKENEYIITELKYVKEYSKNKEDYIKNSYNISKEQNNILIDFFSPELHLKTKELLQQQTSII